MASRKQCYRILVIDDDALMRELLVAVLSADGHTLQAAESGEDALRLLQTNAPVDVVLADLQMPGLAGNELAGQLRSLPATARWLVAMSGSRPAAAELGAYDAFLLKPFQPSDLRRVLKSARTSSSRFRTDDAATPVAVGTGVREPVDEGTFARLASTLPLAKLAELYRFTLDDVTARLRSMQKLREQNDNAGYRREAHAIKGGCGMVGAAELAALAAAAETGSFADQPTLEEFAAACENLERTMAARFP